MKVKIKYEFERSRTKLSHILLKSIQIKGHKLMNFLKQRLIYDNFKRFQNYD